MSAGLHRPASILHRNPRASTKPDHALAQTRGGLSAPVSGHADQLWEGHPKDIQMKHLLRRVTLAATIISPVQAQLPSPSVAPPQWPAAAYPGSTYQRYPFPAPTPRDA